jgi:hypothetical protein
MSYVPELVTAGEKLGPEGDDLKAFGKQQLEEAREMRALEREILKNSEDETRYAREEATQTMEIEMERPRQADQLEKKKKKNST